MEDKAKIRLRGLLVVAVAGFTFRFLQVWDKVNSDLLFVLPAIVCAWGVMELIAGTSAFSIIKKRKAIFSSLVSLVIVVVISFFFITKHHETLQKARQKANEHTAISLLRIISTAQTQSNNERVVDQNQNGIAEYCYLQELAGVVIPRGQTHPIQQPLIVKELGLVAKKNGGITIKNGYHFLCYLPNKVGYIRETSPISVDKPDPTAISLQEYRYIIYAWPQRYGVTGEKAFCIDQRGDVITSDNQIRKYSGFTNIPRFDAALPETNNDYSNHYSQEIQGKDKQIWQKRSW